MHKIIKRAESKYDLRTQDVFGVFLLPLVHEIINKRAFLTNVLHVFVKLRSYLGKVEPARLFRFPAVFLPWQERKSVC